MNIELERQKILSTQMLPTDEENAKLVIRIIEDYRVNVLEDPTYEELYKDVMSVAYTIYTKINTDNLNMTLHDLLEAKIDTLWDLMPRDFIKHIIPDSKVVENCWEFRLLCIIGGVVGLQYLYHDHIIRFILCVIFASTGLPFLISIVHFFKSFTVPKG